MKKSVLSLIAFIFIISSGSLFAEMKVQAAFGGEKDIEYSKYLWQKLEDGKFNSTASNLYLGPPPHGGVREVLEGKIDGKRVLLKRNYGGAGISIEKVEANRDLYLKAITVMIKKDGFNPKNGDWFWAKFKADGTLDKTPKKQAIVGKFPGCIGCHQAAKKTDFVFVHSNELNGEVTLVESLKK